MKITCTTENLKSAVLTAERFTGRHITLPILSHILFIVKEKKILLTATNLETGIEYIIPGKVIKTGTSTSSAKSISQILQSIQDETITLEAKQNQLILHTPSSDITLIGLKPEDFPKLPEIKKEHSFSIPSTILTNALEQVFPAVANTDLKPELSGVLFATNPGIVTFSTTDSFRLSEKTINKVDSVTDKLECIVPSKTIQEILRTLSLAGEVEVEISVGEHQITFEWEGVHVISRLIDGNYPPYKNLIPKAYEATFVVNRGDLLRKIKLASVFSSRLNDVTLTFSPNQIDVTTTNTDTGGTSSRIASKGRGNTGPIMFNYRYLIDGIEATRGENIILNLNGVSGPAMLQNPEDTSFLYLIMPIRST